MGGRWSMEKKCIKCWKILEDEKTIIALDIPRVNLWIHPSCEMEIDNMLQYLIENYEKWYNYYVLGVENE